jgi:hypothetical protein
MVSTIEKLRTLCHTVGKNSDGSSGIIAKSVDQRRQNVVGDMPDELLDCPECLLTERTSRYHDAMVRFRERGETVAADFGLKSVENVGPVHCVHPNLILAETISVVAPSRATSPSSGHESYSGTPNTHRAKS